MISNILLLCLCVAVLIGSIYALQKVHIEGWKLAGAVIAIFFLFVDTGLPLLAILSYLQ